MISVWLLYPLLAISFLSVVWVIVWLLHEVISHRVQQHLPISLIPHPIKHHAFRLPSFWHWKSIGVISALVVGSRLILYGLGLCTLWLENQPVTWNNFQQLWNHWDSDQYLHLAEHGYQFIGEDKFRIVFFPLYPLFIKGLQLLVQDYFLAGLIVSNLALIAACYLLFRLVFTDFGSNIAYQTVKFLLINPLAIFLGVVYTESLFLALALGTFYCLRQRHWLMAGILGMLAALSRSFGVLLIIPALWEFGIWLWHQYNNRRQPLAHLIQTAITSGIGFLLIPGGTALYLGLNKLITGQWLTFLRFQQDHWFHKPIFFAHNLSDIAQSVVQAEPQYSLIIWTPQMVILIGGTLLLVWYARHLRWTYIWFSLAYILMIYSTSWQISGGRYLMVLFPFYIALALATRKRILNDLVTFAFMILLGFYNYVFIKGFAVL